MVVGAVRDEERSSTQPFMQEPFRDSFDEDLEAFELRSVAEDEEVGAGRPRKNSNPLFEDILFEETPWHMLSKREKWSRFWYRLWHGPLRPEDAPATFANPTLARLELVPQKLNAALPYKMKVGIVALYILIWIWAVHFVLSPSLTIPPTYLKADNKKLELVSLSCNSEPAFWKGKNTLCGFDADYCKPFSDREMVFRCPLLCDRGSWTYSSIPIGDQNIKYRGYFVGGGRLDSPSGDELTHPYRADSFPCGAAIHAGILSPFLGGCAKIKYVGSQPKFPSTKGYYGVDDSIEFDSFFPSSFVFTKLDTSWNCYDPRIVVTLINIIFGFPVIFFLGGFVLFWVITTCGFWTICLALDPPVIVNVLDPESLPTLISVGLSRFLPSIFILYTLWHFAIGNTLKTEKDTQVLRTLFWYPLFWLGVLNNVTFDRLPVDRLNIADIKEQSGALLLILSIVTLISTCAVIQAYKLWKTGKFRIYFYIYLTFVLCLFGLAQLPGLTLRVHHYILAMLLIPGTGTKGFTAMLFQGLLVGLFLSGASRWGLASIAETTRALRRSDPSGAVVPPKFLDYNNSTHVLEWETTKEVHHVVDGEILHPSDELNGYSLLINDVERFLGNETSIDLGLVIEDNKELNKLVQQSLLTSQEISLYLRISKASASGKKYSDFTKAAVLKWPSGEFTKPEPGVT